MSLPVVKCSQKEILMLPAPTSVPPADTPVYDTLDVAWATGESPATVRRRCAEGKYPHNRWGRNLRFTARDLDLILALGRRP